VQSVVAAEDVSWLYKHNHIGNIPSKDLGPIDWVHTASNLHICDCEDGMHCLRNCSIICVLPVFFSSTLESRWMGDNLEFFGEVLGHFLVIDVLYDIIIQIPIQRAVLRVHNIGNHNWGGDFGNSIEAAIGVCELGLRNILCRILATQNSHGMNCEQ